MNFYTFLLVLAAMVISVAGASPSKKGKLGLYGFSFKDCGGPTAALKGNISLSPTDPITLPGKLTVGFNATFDLDIKSPLKTVLKIKKKEFVWIDLPCVDGIGSCTYDDFCSKIPPTPPSGCPPPLKEKGLPCRCPIKAGKYSLPPSVFVIPEIKGIPEFLADGEYQANVKLYYGTKELGCVDLAFKLKLNE